MVSLAAFPEVEAAISSWPHYAPTALHSLNGLARQLGIAGLYYKDEGARFGLGSFKALGGAYGVMRLLARKITASTGRNPSVRELLSGAFRQITETVTVTTATDGNHGRSVAWGAKLFGCNAAIYVPVQCSPDRRHAIAAFGATVIQTDVGYDDTVRHCATDAARHGRDIVSDTTWPGYWDVPRDVTQGYTIMVEEALRALPASVIPTHVFVQGGVGALAAAVAGHLWERLGSAAPKIVVVEPVGAACLFASAEAGHAAACTGTVGSIMAGLACGETSPQAWEVLDRSAYAFMTVADATAVECMRLLAAPPFGDIPIVAGESAVAGLAGLSVAAENSRSRTALDLNETSQVLVFGTEGDTDPTIYRSHVGQDAATIRRTAASWKGQQ